MDKTEERKFDGSNNEQSVKEELYTKVVRAGKRTYFFDVKATRKDDYFLTITESTKKFGNDGNPFYEKHKIYLYKEDFEKFMNGLSDAVSFIENNALASVEYTNVEFEDLGENKS
jgi:hypothetical protein